MKSRAWASEEGFVSGGEEGRDFGGGNCQRSRKKGKDARLIKRAGSPIPMQ